MPPPLASEAHQAAQQRIQDQVQQQVARTLEVITLDDRGETVRTAYQQATARTVAGGQRLAAQMARAYMASHFPPTHEVDLGRALEPRLMKPADDGATAGLLRLWNQVDEGVPEADARAEAGSFAANLATGDIMRAARIGGDVGMEAGDAEGTIRWAKVPNDDACDWCRLVGDGTPGSYRYMRAETVPMHNGCRCGFDYREIEALDAEGAEPDLLEFESTGDWETDRENLKRLDTSGWFADDATRDMDKHLDQLMTVGQTVEDEADFRYRDYVFSQRNARIQGPTRDISEFRREVLSEIRPFAERGTLTLEGADSALTEAMEHAESRYPAAWVQNVQDKYPYGITMSRTDRGFNSGGSYIALSGQDFSHTQLDVATHELGHSMQKAVPRLQNAEFVYHRSRTISTDGVRDDITSLYPRTDRADEVGRPDRYKNVYSGREYRGSRSLEVVTTSMEDVFAARPDALFGSRGRYADRGMQEWLMGVLAVL